MPEDWQPSCSPDMLLKRADLLHKVRDFMSERGILEVDTPALNKTHIPDVNIDNISARLSISGKVETYFLHTSPEACMKRLLASGSGAIYQIVKVFRDNEVSPLHQPEFSMLEWYRPDYDHHALMDELAVLLTELQLPAAEKYTYESRFLKHLNLNPHTATLIELKSLASDLGLQGKPENRSLLLDFLFSHSVAPNLGKDKPVLLYDYPACQAALARLTNTKPARAERFELFINGVELANGFHELCDADEQEQRFKNENLLRSQSEKSVVPIDEQFLAALKSGLPNCAGVALGIDRLLMILSEKQSINDVMTFPLADA